MNFDWDSFWLNIISETIFFIFGLLLSLWLIPVFTIRLLRRKNKKFIVQKLSQIVIEICDFINELPNEYNLKSNSVAIYTEDKKNYVALLYYDVLEKLNTLLLKRNILGISQEKPTAEAYIILQKERARLLNLKHELENIIGIHSLNIDDSIILKISELCFEIKRFDHKFKNNYVYDELNAERTGVFGWNELVDFYSKIIFLLEELLNDPLFTKEKQSQ